MSLTFQAQDSSVDSAGAPVEKIVIGKNEPFEFRHFIVHLALYQFFTNLGSVLDRLAYEINLLYGLPIKKVDWPKLVKAVEDKNKHWDKLKNKDPKLARYIARLTSKFAKALRYRNRLVHDGIIRFEADIHLPSGSKVLLLQDPDDDASHFSENAVTFCKRTKTKVLKSLDGSYELMLQHIGTHGKPPW